MARKNKRDTFYFQLLTDSVSVSLLFKKEKQKVIDQKTIDQKLIEKYEQHEYVTEGAIDLNAKTYIAFVGRNIETGDEENIKISSPRFHWETKSGVRDRRAKHLTHYHTLKEQQDVVGRNPSARGETWSSYIKHRLRMLQSGMSVYARRKYAYLDFAKYVETNRVLDKIALKLTKNQATIIYLGKYHICIKSY